jgi:hypothetical protein
MTSMGAHLISAGSFAGEEGEIDGDRTTPFHSTGMVLPSVGETAGQQVGGCYEIPAQSADREHSPFARGTVAEIRSPGFGEPQGEEGPVPAAAAGWARSSRWPTKVEQAWALQGCGLISASRTARTMPLARPLIRYCGSPDGVSGISCDDDISR